jgi:hypothetical protein
VKVTGQEERTGYPVPQWGTVQNSASQFLNKNLIFKTENVAKHSKTIRHSTIS